MVHRINRIGWGGENNKEMHRPDCSAACQRYISHQQPTLGFLLFTFYISYVPQYPTKKHCKTTFLINLIEMNNIWYILAIYGKLGIYDKWLQYMAILG